jgi:hypothetical protein
MRHAMTLAVAVLLAWPAVAQAQSLAEAAAKEREKRKGHAPGKVLTEDDLRTAGRSGNANVDTGAQAPNAAASPAAGKEGAATKDANGKPKEKTEDEIRAEQQNVWRDKLKKAQEDVSRLSGLVGQIQTSVNDMTGNVYGSQRTALLNNLEKAKADLQAAQQQVGALQEEGRRNRFQ